MKKIAILAAVLSFLAFVPFQGNAQSLPRVYDAQKTSQSIKIDGRLDEQSWKDAALSDGFADISGYDYPAPTKNTSVKMLWDDKYLYIGAFIEEDNITGSLKKRDDIIWKDNDFEIFIDPYHDSKLYYEFEFNALGTVMDLLMDKPYSKDGVYMMTWDCKGLKSAVKRYGSLNKPDDKDKGWSLEVAVPMDAFDRDSKDARARRIWRINFSRVEWVKADEPENWVWNPTGKVDMHIPENWGYIRFCNGDDIPQMAHRYVKNWMWERFKPEWSDEEYLAHFRKAYDCGIYGICFEGYDERVYRLCKEAGLKAHYWLWTMNKEEILKRHPEWGAVNRKGESTYDNPPYVDYYRFLCPTHPEIADTLAAEYLRCANLKYVDGMQLDYVRFPDVILPSALWKNYGIDQSSELPEYDYCYCDLCRSEFRKQTGRDPLEEEFPNADPYWENFRVDAISRVVSKIYYALKAENKFLSADVFPTPSMARRMVRQEWDKWPVKALFPMIYNGFYNQGTEWIGRAVKECVEAVDGRAAIYAGLFYPDIEGDDFEKALDEAFRNGASGVSFFDGPDDKGLEQLKAYIAKHNYCPDRDN